MNFADKLTFSRIILAPVFLVLYLLPNTSPLWAVPVLIFLYVTSQVTDYLDGWVARKYNLISDFGKFFDPFADTLVQITFFLSFLVDGIWGSGIFPLILFLIVVYRELGILLIRNLMLRKGTTMGARKGGKIKTVAYIHTGGFALLVSCLERLSVYEILSILHLIIPYIRITAFIVFIISVIISIISFVDYLLIYQKAEKVT